MITQSFLITFFDPTAAKAADEGLDWQKKGLIFRRFQITFGSFIGYEINCLETLVEMTLPHFEVFTVHRSCDTDAADAVS